MPRAGAPTGGNPLDPLTADHGQCLVPLPGLESAAVVVMTEVGVECGGCGNGHLVVGVVCPLPGKVAGSGRSAALARRSVHR